MGMITNFASGKMEKNFNDAIFNGVCSIDLADKKSKMGVSVNDSQEILSNSNADENFHI